MSFLTNNALPKLAAQMRFRLPALLDVSRPQGHATRGALAHQNSASGKHNLFSGLGLMHKS